MENKFTIQALLHNTGCCSDNVSYNGLPSRLLQEVGTGVLETRVQSETRLISRNFGKHHWILMKEHKIFPFISCPDLQLGEIWGSYYLEIKQPFFSINKRKISCCNHNDSQDIVTSSFILSPISLSVVGKVFIYFSSSLYRQSGI